ncbi:DUF397 domain-containing protein [Streptomyces sp. NPDC005302]|uniref:DUF397 domain-containing protein n=1 Tax=Streptomyces sp. NPDC005302 TaxID=3154675 RepID=UPI0033B0DD60
MSTEQLTWIKSSFSGGEGGECVEVAASPRAVRVRDSKDPRGPQLALSPGSWSAFLAGGVLGARTDYPA